MARLFISGVAPRARGAAAQPVVPRPVTELFGRPPAKGYWSGLYGTTSTREGLKRLLQSARGPVSIFRAVCHVPGGIVTSMSIEDLARLGYLNVRYADAPLFARLEGCWSTLADAGDPQQAMPTRPDLAPAVVADLGLTGINLIIHPFKVPETQLALSIATVLDTGCIEDVRSRDRGLSVQWS